MLPSVPLKAAIRFTISQHRIERHRAIRRRVEDQAAFTALDTRPRPNRNWCLRQTITRLPLLSTLPPASIIHHCLLYVFT